MKKLILLFAVVLMFSLVSSAQPVQINTGAIGIQVEYSNYDIAKQNTGFQLNTHAFNVSDGNILTVASTDCSFHLYNSTGHGIYDEMFLETAPHEFYADINSSIFNDVGLHSYLIHCNSTGIGGFASGNYNVNPTGIELTVERSIIYIGLLAILIFLFVVALGGATMLPTGNNRNDEGELVSISNLKHLKPILFVIAYLLMIAITFIGSNIALAYLGATLMGDILFTIFNVMFILALPMIVVWLIFLLVSIFQDKQLKRLLEHGMGDSV